MRLLTTGAVLAAALLVPSTAQASCVEAPPREERLAAADAAVAGTVVRQEGSVYTLRVERGVKASFGAELRVRDEAPNTSIGLSSLRPGVRVGLLLRRDSTDTTNGDGADYVSNDCLKIGADDLIAAAVEQPQCEAGDGPARPYPRARYAVRPRVLACGRTPGGTAFQIVGYRKRGRARPCLDLLRLPSGPATGCGDGRVRDGGVIDVDGRAGRLLSGTAPVDIGGVAVRYRTAGGRDVERQSALAVVRDERTLARLRIKRPFATWVADFPRGGAATALVPHFAYGGEGTAESLSGS